MRLVFSNENRFIVANARNILAHHGVEVVLKNEYTAGVLGEVSPFDAWVEIWVVNDEDYERACAIIESSLSHENEPDWLCEHCNEVNDASFETCWKCQRPK